jgi:hypothetical protein
MSDAVESSLLPTGRKPEPHPATGTDTVTVGCKITNGLILRVHDMEEDFEPLFGGGQKRITKAVQVGDDVVLRGSALNLDELRGGRLPPYPHSGGYALTHGVPRDFWERWKKEHADDFVVKNHLVFAADTTNRAYDEAREMSAVESGFEGIDPDNPGKRTGIRTISRGERPR